MTDNLRPASDTKPIQPLRVSSRRWIFRVLMAIAFLIITLFLLYPPTDFIGKADLVGRGICHQYPSHSFFVAGKQLPLCARCTGIYLGALLGLAGFFLLGRQRAAGFPPVPILAILVGFIGIMALDGINSMLADIPNVPHLYEPQNWLRLVTGTFHGLAMISILYPAVSETVWHPSRISGERVIENFRELAGFLLGAIVIIGLVLWRPPFMLYPLAFLSSFGVVLMLTFINAVLVLVIFRREGSAITGNDWVFPMVLGLAVSILILSGMVALRTYVGNLIGVPI